MRPRSVVILVLLILFFVVIVQNTEVVTARLLFWDFTMSHIILLAASLGIGVIIGFLLGRPWRKRTQYAISKQVSEKQRDTPFGTAPKQ